MIKKTFFPAFILIAALCLLAPSANAAPETAPIPTEFAARDLWLAFKNDQSKAEQDIIGKTIKIQGVVVETGMSVYLTPNVRLSDNPNGVIYVTCVLPRSDTGLLSSFTRGESVTMQGRAYRFSSSGYVVIKESRRVTGE